MHADDFPMHKVVLMIRSNAHTGDFPVHKIILGADKYQIENMKLVDVPEGLGTVFVSLPLKVEGGPEAETRVMAIVPSSTPSQSL